MARPAGADLARWSPDESRLGAGVVGVRVIL